MPDKTRLNENVNENTISAKYDKILFVCSLTETVAVQSFMKNGKYVCGRNISANVYINTICFSRLLWPFIYTKIVNSSVWLSNSNSCYLIFIVFKIYFSKALIGLVYCLLRKQCVACKGKVIVSNCCNFDWFKYSFKPYA